MAFLENWKLKRQLRTEGLRAELAQTRLANNQFESIAKLEVQRFAQPDPDEGNWNQIGGGLSNVTGGKGMNLRRYDHYEMLKQAYDFWQLDLFARAIVRNLSKFVLGKGPTIKPVSENQKVNDQWKKFCKINKWSIREKEMVRRVFRDGEIFIRKFKEDGNLKVRFLRADNIKNPPDSRNQNKGEEVTLGIGTDPEDVEDVKTYYLCNKEGKFLEAIPADQVIHVKILVDSDVKRGISFLLVAMPMLKKYSEWLDDRIVLNKVRTAIALIKKVTGTSGTVDSIRDKQLSERQSADKYKQKAFNAGTIITASKGIEYEMLSPNINAADAANDGRNMLLGVAAGCGMPEMMLTADYSNANYSSSVTAQNPFVREVEDWQDFWEFYYMQLFEECIIEGKEKGDIPENESTECIVAWPPLILADIQKNNAAREIQHRNKILSKKTWSMKEDLDPELEKKNLELEAGEEVYQGMNMPVAPVNQYGAVGDE